MSRQDFKDTKKAFREAAAVLDSTLDEFPNVHDLKKKDAVYERAKKEIQTAEKKIKELDGTYRLLDNSDKAYYSQKLSSLQKEYADLRRLYFQMEDNMNQAKNQDKVNGSTLEGANMKLREGNRERLLNGVDNLQKADGQIDRIKGVAIETHGVMVDANREINDQGHLIDSAAENVALADASTTRTKKRVVVMTRKEYWYKFILYVLIVLLFLGDIASVISKFA